MVLIFSFFWYDICVVISKKYFMRKLMYLMVFVFTAFVANAQTDLKIKFNEVEHNFGNAPQGKPVTHEFLFTNTGTDPLILESVKASCGCTTPEWSKEPIMPGKTGTIKAQYNMAREGSFRKSITVVTKSGESVVLYVSGNAVPQTDGVDGSSPSMIGK
jgi:hypothetical protein